jgi:hypothetical protein
MKLGIAQFLLQCSICFWLTAVVARDGVAVFRSGPRRFAAIVLKSLRRSRLYHFRLFFFFDFWLELCDHNGEIIDGDAVVSGRIAVNVLETRYPEKDQRKRICNDDGSATLFEL